MSKATCLPDRQKDKYICQMCGTNDRRAYEWRFFFLEISCTPEAAKAGFQAGHERKHIFCETCIEKIYNFIEKVRDDEQYYKTRCHRLEGQIRESNRPAEQKLITDENIADREGWQDEDRTTIEVERVYATRYDCSTAPG